MELDDLIKIEKVKHKITSPLLLKHTFNINGVSCPTYIYQDKITGLYSLFYFYFSMGKGWSLYGSKLNIDLLNLLKTLSLWVIN